MTIHTEFMTFIFNMNQVTIIDRIQKQTVVRQLKERYTNCWGFTYGSYYSIYVLDNKAVLKIQQMVDVGYYHDVNE